MASRSASTPTKASRGRRRTKASSETQYFTLDSSSINDTSMTSLSSNLITSLTSASPKKRKHEVIVLSSDPENNDEEDDDAEFWAGAANAASLNDVSATHDVTTTTPAKTPWRRTKKDISSKPPQEKRLRVVRKNAPQSYLQRLNRVKTQRMFLIDRDRTLHPDGTHQVETFDIAGTTGNLYKVTISKLPKCTCPDAQKGNQCKHIIYVMVNILKAPEHLAYQLALLTTELEEIFRLSPTALQASSSSGSQEDTSHPGKRKPIEGDCAICMMEFSAAEAGDIVWCKAACGNNIHKQCFEHWAAAKHGEVKCVYCRTEWKRDEGDVNLEIIKKMGASKRKNSQGYVNVAQELGISGRRDVSTYHQFWVRQQRRRGRLGPSYEDYEWEDDYEDEW